MTPLLTAGTNYVYHARAESLLRWLPDASVDLILTDPPFNVGKADWDSWSTVQGYLDWLDMHLAQFRRVMKPNGSLYLFCATKHAAKVELTVEKHFNVLNNIRWRKPAYSTKAEMSDKETMRAYFPASESIIFAEKYCSDSRFADADYLLWGRTIDPLRMKLRMKTELHKENLIAVYAADGRYTTRESIRVNAARQLGWLPTEFELMTEKVYRAVNAVADLGMSYQSLRGEYEDLRREYEDLRRPFFGNEHRPYADVWEYPTVNTYPGKHPCEKPLDMLRDIIQTSSREGDVVLDPFAGSGATLVAAKELKRRYIGGDFDGHWVKRTNARLALPQQLELFAA